MDYRTEAKEERQKDLVVQMVSDRKLGKEVAYKEEYHKDLAVGMDRDQIEATEAN